MAIVGTGCQKSDTGTQAANTRVVVYDIDRVAHDMGWATDMQTTYNLKTSFESDLKKAREMYAQQILAQKKQWSKGHRQADA